MALCPQCNRILQLDQPVRDAALTSRKPVEAVARCCGATLLLRARVTIVPELYTAGRAPTKPLGHS